MVLEEMLAMMYVYLNVVQWAVFMVVMDECLYVLLLPKVHAVRDDVCSFSCTFSTSGGSCSGWQC